MAPHTAPTARAAALRVTKAAPKALKVAPGFVAFPIDWELEGDDLGKIIDAGGAGKPQGTPTKARRKTKPRDPVATEDEWLPLAITRPGAAS